MAESMFRMLGQPFDEWNEWTGGFDNDRTFALLCRPSSRTCADCGEPSWLAPVREQEPWAGPHVRYLFVCYRCLRADIREAVRRHR
jgi:hypothetical protein